MGTVTGIELGPDSCVFVAVRPRRGRPIEVRAFRTIERAEWPSHDTAVAAALEAVRRQLKLPRRARVVSWELPDGARVNDPVAVATLRPLTAAGFRVETVLSPVQALVRLAASRPRPDATAWLALNVHGAAIAIVRGAELLFERTFTWAYNAEAAGTRAQLLQRYSLVAQLAPELRRGLSDVSHFNNVTVGTVITCGDLPDLRSLTMPLIEELDLEVETLDSTDGLEAAGRARMERFPESAPALRLACAAATAAPASARLLAGTGARIAAAAAILVAVGLGALVIRNNRAEVEPAAVTVRRQAPQTPSATAAAKPAPVPAPVAPAPAPISPGPSETATATSGRTTAPPAPVVPAPGPATTTPMPASPAPAARAPITSLPPPAVTTSRPAPPAPSPAPAVRAPITLPPATSNAPAVKAPITLPPAAAERTPPPARPPGKAEAPLKDPLPKLDSVLIDQNRRLAIVDGGMAAVGDRIGSRVIVAINRDGIVLREPSGLEVRVPLRLAVGRPD
ncbi:MAG: hypothetical protein ABI603_09365 [Acidobacteriota bacterium]